MMSATKPGVGGQRSIPLGYGRNPWMLDGRPRGGQRLVAVPRAPQAEVTRPTRVGRGHDGGLALAVSPAISCGPPRRPCTGSGARLPHRRFVRPGS